ncbi:MAG: hypothetical protein SF052_20695 [Bacteroidia bacterium]|nr:hypothetical protein [Bacteroidia bacterium]
MKQRTAQEMRPLLDSYAQYGGSKKAFCRERGIAEHTLDYWRRKLARVRSAASAFIALEVDRMNRSGSIEMYYPNGVRIEFSREDLLFEVFP